MRTIRWNKQFEADLIRIFPGTSEKNKDDFIKCAEDILSVEPEYGVRIEDTPIWFLPLSHPFRETSLNIYYMFDDNQVEFLSVALIPLEPY